MRRFGIAAAALVSLCLIGTVAPSSRSSTAATRIDRASDAEGQSEQTAAPLYDNFADAVPIFVPFFDAPDLDFATVEAGESALACGGSTRSVWYSYRVPGTTTLMLTASGQVSYMAGYRGSSLGSLTEIGCTERSALNLAVEAGETIYIRVAGSSPATFQVKAQPPPVNDTFEAPMNVELPFQFVVDTRGATRQLGEPQPFGCESIGTVWYRFHATQDIAIKIDTAMSDYNMVMAAYHGTSLADLVQIDCRELAPRGTAVLHAMAGETVYLQFGSPRSAATIGGRLSLHINAIPTLPNDHFVNATAITTFPFFEEAELEVATTEPLEPADCHGTLSNTVWYSITAPPAEDLTVSIDGISGSDSNTIVAAYAGSSLDALSLLGCTGTNPIVLTIGAGATVHIRAGMDLGYGGGLELRVSTVVPALNDRFDDATTITALPFTETIDNSTATNEIGEPRDCGTSRTIGNTVWYRFTASHDLNLKVALHEEPGSDFALHAYRGSSFADLTTITCFALADIGLVPIQAGETIMLQLGGDGGDMGTVELLVEEVFVPANDHFADATLIESLPFSATVEPILATQESGEPICNAAGRRSVWYRFVASDDFVLKVETEHRLAREAVGVYVGTSLATLESRGCDHIVQTRISAGDTVYFRAGGDDRFTFDVTRLVSPAHDDFANAKVISDVPFTETVSLANASTEFGEPHHCDQAYKSVWYKFVSPADMILNVDTNGSHFGSNVTAYSGDSLQALTALACDYDSQGVRIHVPVQSGEPIYIQLAARSELSASIVTVSFTSVELSANDHFADAESVPSLPYIEHADLSTATVELGEPSPCGAPHTHSLWYGFTAPNDMTILIRAISPDEIPIKLAVYTGASLDALTPFHCEFWHFPVAEATVAAGTVVHIQVGADFDGYAAVTLNIDTDSDGDRCTDGHELGDDHALGGQRDRFDYYDFYDATEDAIVDLSDTLLILSHFGHGPGQDEHDERLDREISDLTQPWLTAHADDGIDLNDALANLASFGDDCRGWL